MAEHVLDDLHRYALSEQERGDTVLFMASGVQDGRQVTADAVYEPVVESLESDGDHRR